MKTYPSLHPIVSPMILFKIYGTLFYSPICQTIIKEPSQTSHYFGRDEYHFATAKTVEEAGKLITAGFEYVCHHKGKSHLGSLSKR